MPHDPGTFTRAGPEAKPEKGWSSKARSAANGGLRKVYE